MDTPEEQWPPFTRRCFFGHWFWEHYWAGRIISLSDLIAGTPETVFWTKTKGIMDSDCCVVVRDIANSKGGTLRRGIYVLSEALLAGKPIPPLHTLISNADKTDLTTRFQHFLRDADPAHR
jgi:hypothetical protein